MKKILFFLLLIAFAKVLFSQSEIRLLTQISDGIGPFRLVLSDSNDFIVSVFHKNASTGIADSSFIQKIGKDGTILKTLYVSNYFPGSRIYVQKFIKHNDGNYIGLLNLLYGDTLTTYKTALIYFNDNLDVTSIKMIGDTSKSLFSGTFIINSNQQIILSGNKYKNDSSNVIDSVFIKKLSIEGDIIKEFSFKDTQNFQITNSLIELSYYGVYVIGYPLSPIHYFVDTNFQAVRKIWYGSMDYLPATSYPISDRKFITSVDVYIDDSITYLPLPKNVGFVIRDTTPSPSEIDTISPVPVVYQFGELVNEDWGPVICFIQPDTVLLLFFYWGDPNISYNNVFTLVKTTTTGNVIWSKDYISDVNRYLFVTATDNNIILYGLYWQGNDERITDPIIISLNKEGEVIATIGNFHLTPNNILLYPNPAKNDVNIQFDNSVQKMEQLKISNIMGQTVYEKDISSSTNINQTVDVSSFAKGAYFVHLKGKNKIKTEKLIIQ